MTGRNPITEIELSAFVDGELDDARMREVEAMLGSDIALAECAAGFASDKDMLKRIYAPVAERPIPKEWIALARGGTSPTRTRSWRSIGVIAAVLVVALAGAVGYWRSHPTAAREIVADALDARAHADKGERNITVAGNARPGQYDTALRETVAMNVKVPSLEKMGYRLAAIHLFPKSGGGAAELVYRDKSDRLFTLYLRHSDGVARFDQFERQGLRVCLWQDEELGAVMMGNVSTATMQRLASLAYIELTL